MADTHAPRTIATRGPARSPGNEVPAGVAPQGGTPAPVEASIGRDREIALIADLIRHRRARLITLLGPGGVGKTHLASLLMHRLVPEFRDGVCVVSFAQATSETAWETLARALEVTNASHAPWPAALRDALRSRKMLLVLDNCETVAEGLGELADLLAACPGVIVLATSQEALRLRDEREHWLEPLALPDAAGSRTAEALRRNPAVALFALRAARVKPGFTISDADPDDLIAIVRMLDGLPLAIELAAAQVRHLSLPALRQRLASALPSLGGGPRDRPERHRSLRDAVGWSLSLLRPEERAVFLRLSVFAGGFTPEAAVTVARTPSTRDGWELLLGFADRSLLKRIDDDGTPRFLMLETVRAVARDLLRQEAAGERAALERHAQYVLSLAREADHHLHGPDQLAWLRRLDLEQPDIMAVMERGLTDVGAATTALTVAGHLSWYWYTRGPHGWAIPLIERLLDRVGNDAPAGVRGPAHVTAGWLAFKRGQTERAERHFEAACRLLPEMDSRAALLARLGRAYVLAYDRRDRRGAVALLRELAARARDVAGAWHEEAAAHFGVGLLAYFERDLPLARTAIERTLRLARAHDDPQSTGLSLVYLANLARLAGDPAGALDRLREAVPALQAVGDQTLIALAMDAAVCALVALDDLPQAQRVLAAADHLRRVSGIPRSPMEDADIADARARLRPDAAASERASPSDVLGTLADYRAPRVGARRSGPEPAALSERELEVLRLVAAGLTASEIAARLFLSHHTVKRHMANIRQKLGVRSQAAAVAVLHARDASRRS